MINLHKNIKDINAKEYNKYNQYRTPLKNHTVEPITCKDQMMLESPKTLKRKETKKRL